MEKKLVGKVVLTKEEISIAFTYLFSIFGLKIKSWTHEQQEKAISDYWLERGKSDMSIIKDIT